MYAFCWVTKHCGKGTNGGNKQIVTQTFLFNNKTLKIHYSHKTDRTIQ